MAQSQSPKKTPSKFVDVCHVCSETFSSVENKQNLLLGHDSSVWLDYTLALEDVTGRVMPGDGLPRVRMWERRYGCSKADVEQIGTLVREKTSSRIGV